MVLAVLSALGVGGWVKTRRFLPSGALAVIAAAATAVVQSLAHMSPTSALNGAAAEIRNAPPVTTTEKDPADELEVDKALEDPPPLIIAEGEGHCQDAAKNQAEVAALKAR